LTIKIRGSKDKYNGFTFGNIKVLLDLNASTLPCGISGKIAIDDFYKDKTNSTGGNNKTDSAENLDENKCSILIK